jgi:hypothetical protein
MASAVGCKRHFGNSSFSVRNIDRILKEEKEIFWRIRCATEVGIKNLLLLFPALASVRSRPGFVACGGQFPVLIIFKLNANDV